VSTRNEGNTIAFMWESGGFSGAQKRFAAIAAALSQRGFGAVLLLDERDAQSMQRRSKQPIPHLHTYRLPWWLRLLRRGHWRAPRLWRSLGMRDLYLAGLRRFFDTLLTRHHVGMVHLAMSDHFAHAIPRPTLFEVTSPDWAERIGHDPRIVPEHVALHAVSESVDERLRQHLPHRTIWCAPMAFPNVTIGPDDAPSRENLVLFGHRLIPRKNGVTFARAAKRFLATHPTWRIHIRGSGPDTEAIAAILASEIATGRAALGFVADLPAELRRSRIFVSIIEADNYPSQSVIEAMACGNALLLSDRGRSREKFFDGNGRMTEVDEEAVVGHLSAMASDPIALARMGEASRRLARERFSQEAYLTYLLGVYRRVGFAANGGSGQRDGESGSYGSAAKSAR
jgi:glycosyltransferase involved in cell wall biosynthesis